MVFGGIFLMTTVSLAGFLLVSRKVQNEKAERERAVHIAEAGLNYYKWHLAHFPDDLEDGTGGVGPYEHAFEDPEGGEIGTFSLEVDGNLQCSLPTAVDITSTGWTSSAPSTRRQVFGRYARPSVAEYSYIINTNVWAGADRTITGKYHSNGGVRMDADNRSTVSSSVSLWQCTGSFGCSPTQNKDGVFGAGSNPAFWSYPTPQVDFAGISADLANMKQYARDLGGIYFAPAGGQSSRRGYHLIFRTNGTFDVYRVTDTTPVWGYSSEAGWQEEYNIIAAETYVGNYMPPSGCSVVFVEDRVWLEGTVVGKVAVVSADVSSPTYATDIILSGNILYGMYDGTSGLTAIAERNVLIPLNSPENMELHGIFVAQGGRYGRNYYTTSGSTDVPSSYDAYVIQGTLTTVGTVVSNGRTGTQWTCSGTPCSGYLTRVDSYDGKLATNPPPFTPYTSSDFRFVEWREE